MSSKTRLLTRYRKGLVPPPRGPTWLWEQPRRTPPPLRLVSTRPVPQLLAQMEPCLLLPVLLLSSELARSWPRSLREVVDMAVAIWTLVFLLDIFAQSSFYLM
jgi:hypothetical protein